MPGCALSAEAGTAECRPVRSAGGEALNVDADRAAAMVRLHCMRDVDPVTAVPA